jgi:D-alanine-D-alanine ligase
MLNVAIVAGGDSGEYEISMKSGKMVELSLDYEKFRPFLVEIRKAEWVYRVENKKFRVDKNDFSLTIGKKKILFDVVFNAIHGTPGENGRLTGYFEMLGIPVTSGDATNAALTFNKAFCKDVVARHGILTARSVRVFKGDPKAGKYITDNLTFPLFVKPNNGGSSVGMSKVNFRKEMNAALEKAFREDDELIVEEFVKGRELTCGVYRAAGKVIPLPVTEIISKKEFFDYEAKYNAKLSDEVVPAHVPSSVSGKCREISAHLYEKLCCRGIVRFDFIYSGNKFYFLEVNTVPGLTAESIVPKMLKAAGIELKSFYSMLIAEALQSKILG